ncbi:class I SAM-dependent methyltransferase [Metabacillus litoralis]|uniref:class I SAM-dependent methyltransferase n=1 Tax=Metabacillus litoralis TaxID=152268 RepID=UPI001CFE72A4|nr:class I SAM-dependent methyltransferase [Metabacillus litoralis]
MITEYIRIFKARGWMKRNMPFLYTWHAYVGYELNLYSAFKKPKTIEEVAEKYSLQKDLLQRWMDVGVAISYMKKGSKGRFRTIKKIMLPASKNNPSSSGAILKEMMELHIPTLLSYPSVMKTKEKHTFNEELHGTVVAQTSSMLEQLALRKISKLVKKNNVQTLVDVGCGHGGYLQKLAEKYPQINMYGLEANEEVSIEAKKRSEHVKRITIEHVDAFEWYPKTEIDFVMVHNLLHYLSTEDRKKLFTHIGKWLSKGGTISIMTPIQNGKHGQQFSSVFNSFFSAYENLFPLPTKEEIGKIAKHADLSISSYSPIVKEAGWYLITLEK